MVADVNSVSDCYYPGQELEASFRYVLDCTPLRSITIVQCYASHTYIVEKDAIYEQHLSKGDIVIMTGDPNAKVGSDNTLLGHVTGKHNLCYCNNNFGRFVDFCYFHHLVVGGTLLEHKAVA